MTVPAQKIAVHVPRMARLADLEKSSYNPREMNDEERAGLRASLLEFGLVENLVVNRRTGKLVGGHQRLDELRAAGVEEAPVVEVDLPPAKEKALNVTLNNDKIAGRFTAAVVGLLDEIRVELPEEFAALRLDDLADGLPFEAEEGGAGGGGEGTGGDPGEDRYKEQYGVIVVCVDAAEQERVFNDLQATGYTVRVVVT